MRQPRYRQLSEALFDQITTGALPVGARVPSEHDLCTEYALSRGTVREALRHLEELGMISRSRLGTTVASLTPVDAYQPGHANSTEIEKLIERTKILHPVASETRATKAMALRLDVPYRSRWFTLVGPLVLRDSPHTVLCWSEHYHSTADDRNVMRSGAYDASHARGSLEQVVSASGLDAEIAEVLGAEPGSPALVVRRRRFTPDGRLSKVSIHTHRGDQFRVTTISDEADSRS